MARHILIVDDDLLRRSVAFNLERAGFHTQTAGSAEAGLASAETDPPDLVLLDINLPGMDGLSALRHFRDRLGLPVILVTARRREFDEVLGLELGADDYITKPFDNDVLVARIKAALRRLVPRAERSSQPDVLSVGDLKLDPQSMTVTVDGQSLTLSVREFQILYALAQQPGRVLSAEELLDRVWGAEYMGEVQTVYVYMNWLREKLEADPRRPRRIVTIRSAGYKLVPQDGER